MAWDLLPTDYTDAVWSGLKKYSQVDNSDGTVSFQDVTVYTNKEKSFFGAKDANQMNEALNTIMSMVESGTDLYTAFQNYFAEQKLLFESKADTTQVDLSNYVAGLKKEGDDIIASLETDYKGEITQFENIQEQVFTTWFESVRGQLSTDVAGKLELAIEGLDERLTLLEHMVIANDISAPITTDDDEPTLLVDSDGKALLTSWSL